MITLEEFIEACSNLPSKREMIIYCTPECERELNKALEEYIKEYIGV